MDLPLLLAHANAVDESARRAADVSDRPPLASDVDLRMALADARVIENDVLVFLASDAENGVGFPAQSLDRVLHALENNATSQG